MPPATTEERMRYESGARAQGGLAAEFLLSKVTVVPSGEQLENTTCLNLYNLESEA